MSEPRGVTEPRGVHRSPAGSPAVSEPRSVSSSFRGSPAGSPAVSVHLFEGAPQCQFIFSGKNDELTPDFRMGYLKERP